MRSNMPNQPGKGDPHNWKRLDRYLAIHDRCLETLSTYFVERVSLAITFTNRSQLLIAGNVYCKGDLVLVVRELLDINAIHQVRGIEYKYQAQFTDNPTRIVFRYDNAHRYSGHPDDFHKHTFSPATWKPIHPPLHIGRDRWPTLQMVLEELHQWWVDQRGDTLN